MSLTKDDILKAKDLITEIVPVPEWGGDVIVSTMTGASRDAFEVEAFGADGKQMNMKNLRAALAVATIVDAKGRPVFSSNDIQALGEKSAKALDRVFEVACRLNGITKKDVEELEKNLPEGQNANSTSD